MEPLIRKFDSSNLLLTTLIVVNDSELGTEVSLATAVDGIILNASKAAVATRAKICKRMFNPFVKILSKLLRMRAMPRTRNIAIQLHFTCTGGGVCLYAKLFNF